MENENTKDRIVINAEISGTTLTPQGFRLDFNTELGQAAFVGTYPDASAMNLLLNCLQAEKWEHILGRSMRLVVSNNEITHFRHFLKDLEVPCYLFTAKSQEQNEEEETADDDELEKGEK